MAEWYVRPDSTHGTGLDGKSYEKAWGGWSSIVWGGAGVVAGDTLYVCGAHAHSAGISIGSHGASSSASPVVISGGYSPDLGTIIFSGSVFLSAPRNYTTIEDLAIVADTSHCIYMYPSTEIKGATVQRCTLTGGTGAAIVGLAAANGQIHSDLAFIGNDFIGGTGSPLGGAITWTVAASGLPVSNLNRVTIHGNNFTGNSAGRAVVQLRLEDGANALAGMADIVVSDNTFRDCPTLGMEIVGPSETGHPDYYGRNTGIKITGNKFYDMTPTSATFNLGGAMGIGGFAPSLTEGFGSNIIARNEAYRITGPSGFLNTFYGTYRVFDNYAEDIIASQADGCGILIDHGTQDTILCNNHFRRVTGNEATENSGCGIMILNALTITAYGNIVDGCKIGVYVGNKAAGQSCNVHNNTFRNCSYAGVLFLSTADMTANLIRNNVFTGAASVPSVLIKGGTMTSESGNCYHGFGSATGHTLDASNIDDDPDFDARLSPRATAVKTGGINLGGSDFYGKDFSGLSVAMGAVGVFPARGKVSRNVTSRAITSREINNRMAIAG